MTPIFISGYPKSGTTLIAQLFNNLPDVYIDIELHYAPFALKMLQDAVASGEIKTTVISPDPLAPRIMELSTNNFSGYYQWGQEAFCKLHTGWHKNIRWGNNCKSTVNYFPTLKNLFPDALIINMIRDPRDVWASIKLSKWKGLEHFADLSYFLSRYRQVYSLTELYGITLRYEDLVRNPQSAFDLIGKEFQQEYLKGTGKTFRYRTLPIPKHNNFADEITCSRIGRYKTEVQPSEIAIIEDTFLDILNKYYT